MGSKQGPKLAAEFAMDMLEEKLMKTLHFFVFAYTIAS